MKRTTLLVCTTALAAVALLSARPASALGDCEETGGLFCEPQTETVPEPGTIFGTMLVGTAMAWKKYSNSKKA